MSDLLKYMRSINPPADNVILIYGRKYRLWRDGEYIGIATWTKDSNIGDSFQEPVPREDGLEEVDVYIADKWELIVEK